jgi:hypothetical protein
MVLIDPTQSDEHRQERDKLFSKVQRVLQGLSQLTTKMERKTNNKGEQYGPYYIRFCQGGSCILQAKPGTINQLYTSVSDKVLNAVKDRLVEVRKSAARCIGRKNYKLLKHKIDQYEQVLQPPIHMFKLRSDDDETEDITVQIGVNEKWCCEVETEDQAEKLMLKINECLEPLKEQGHEKLKKAWGDIHKYIIEHDLY